MEKNDVLEILKQAILLESRGRAFYTKVAEQAEESAVREFFEMMASDEQKHMQTLSDQYKAYRKNKKFASAGYDKSDTGQLASTVLTAELKEKIAAAGFEAAAISAAISMEERAVKLYSKNAETAEDPEARALYEWLTAWEREHLNALLDIDKALREKIWFDNKFWSF
ncbi:ferritin family protein [Thermodesulfobacteriota bacterium]